MNNCPLRTIQIWEDIKISSDIDQDQYREVRDLLKEYSDVLTHFPGNMDLTECAIEVTDDAPFRVSAYPVTYALNKYMNKEVRC